MDISSDDWFTINEICHKKHGNEDALNPDSFPGLLRYDKRHVLLLSGLQRA